MALGGETRYMRKQMQEDPGGYGKALLVVMIIGISLFSAFLVFSDDEEQATEPTEPSTTSVLDSGNMNDRGQPSVEEAIEQEHQEAYEEYMRQQAEEYMQMQPEEDDLQNQPY